MSTVHGLKLPASFRDRIEDIRAGRAVPAPARHAATVVVLRDHDRHGLQAFMLRRVRSMAFAPGAYVFPGGSVDPRDGEAELAWSGPAPAEWGSAFKADETLARELVCAAVRETFEETLVLLAGPTGETVVDDTRGDDWEADRQALLDRSQSFGGFLDRRGLVLRADLLRPWAHWITPAIEPKRYDTRFFVAAMPQGQRARDVSTEADQVAWVRPAEAAERAEKGEWMMLPPTIATLAELAEFGTVADVLAARREIAVHEPTAEIIDGEAYLVLPDGVERHYPQG
ncbi:NUDIX hydrolase [Actinomadura latina]|uniref:NUDIX domain-containing protein n=1 Tax=Actinomadura latina TaxID=163603 RepID=A0A846YWU2_9ACTN|nr:NUDIX domain-containing protein [Actinomadura latina]NKZ03172.1 NUDIX domain-containing protein [Actinomadura latina]